MPVEGIQASIQAMLRVRQVRQVVQAPGACGIQAPGGRLLHVPAGDLVLQAAGAGQMPSCFGLGCKTWKPEDVKSKRNANYYM